MKAYSNIICLHCLAPSTEAQYKKTKVFYQGVCKKCCGPTASLDELMVPVIAGLILKGYAPIFSCSGHLKSKKKPDHRHPYLFIKNMKRSMKNLPDLWYLDPDDGRSKFILRADPVETKSYLQKVNQNLLEWVESLPKAKRKMKVPYEL